MRFGFSHKARNTGLVAAAFVLLPALFAHSAWSHDVTQGGRTVSTPQQLNRPPQSASPSNVPGSAHQHVYQRQGYGKGYREGHGVSGAYGTITIWSASPSGMHKAPVQNRPGHMLKQQAVPLTGPKLQYDANYGKPPANDR